MSEDLLFKKPSASAGLSRWEIGANITLWCGEGDATLAGDPFLLARTRSCLTPRCCLRAQPQSHAEPKQHKTRNHHHDITAISIRNNCLVLLADTDIIVVASLSQFITRPLFLRTVAPMAEEQQKATTPAAGDSVPETADVAKKTPEPAPAEKKDEEASGDNQKPAGKLFACRLFAILERVSTNALRPLSQKARHLLRMKSPRSPPRLLKSPNPPVPRLLKSLKLRRSLLLPLSPLSQLPTALQQLKQRRRLESASRLAPLS